MTTRELKFVLSAALLMSSAGPLSAESRAQSIARQLHQQGYSEITVTRTWLGRLRIEAQRDDVEREIIVNRRTGEILRDYSRAERNDQSSSRAQRNKANDGSGDGNNDRDRGGRDGQRSKKQDDAYDDTDFAAEVIGGDDDAYEGIVSGDDPDYDQDSSYASDDAFDGGYDDAEGGGWGGGHDGGWGGGHDGGYDGGHDGGYDGDHDGGYDGDHGGGYDGNHGGGHDAGHDGDYGGDHGHDDPGGWDN